MPQLAFLGVGISGDFLYTKCDKFEVTGSYEVNSGPQAQVGLTWQGVASWNVNSADDFAGEYQATDFSLKWFAGVSGSYSWSKEVNSSGQRVKTFAIGPAVGWGEGISCASGTTVR